MKNLEKSDVQKAYEERMERIVTTICIDQSEENSGERDFLLKVSQEGVFESIDYILCEHKVSIAYIWNGSEVNFKLPIKKIIL
jgi:hypothetical protein